MTSDTFVDRLRTPVVLGAIALVVIATILPVFLGAFEANLLVSIMILGLFAMSFNMLFGYTGLLSFGQAAYFGVAAYAFAIIRAGRIEAIPELSVPLAAVAALLVAILFAAVFGLICVQRGEIYFAMLTLALSMMVFQVANQWTEVSGGEDGVIVSLPPIEVAGITINILDVVTKYYLTLGLLVISMFIIWRVVHSPYGALLIAIRENPQRAKLIGVPVNRYQLSSFIIAGVFSGVAGVLFAVHNFLVTPGLLHWSTSAEPILMTLLGGPSSFFGPLLGAFLFIFLEQALTTITDFWQIGLGLILIPIVLFVPGGVASLLNSARERARLALEDRQEYDRAAETKEKQD